MPKPLRLFACVVVTLLVLINAASASAQPSRPAHHARAFAVGQVASLMLKEIDRARHEVGLPPLRISRVLTRNAAAYGRMMIAQDRWAHALSFQRGTGFRSVGEILALCPLGLPEIRATIGDWLASPEHRPILLGARYRWVGVAFERGAMGGTMAGVWVARFGSR